MQHHAHLFPFSCLLLHTLYARLMFDRRLDTGRIRFGTFDFTRPRGLSPPVIVVHAALGRFGFGFISYRPANQPGSYFIDVSAPRPTPNRVDPYSLDLRRYPVLVVRTVAHSDSSVLLHVHEVLHSFRPRRHEESVGL